MISILGRASSINVRKVLWTAEEAGVFHNHVAWGSGDLRLDNPRFLSMNPNGLVPVLVDGDFVLWESNTICRYLARIAPQVALLPHDRRALALVEQWMDWQSTELNDSWRYAFMALVRQAPDYRDRDRIKASTSNWNQNMEILDRALSDGRRFVTGDNFTLADIVLGLSTHRWLSTPIRRPALVHVAAFRARLAQRPAFAQHVDNGHP